MYENAPERIRVTLEVKSEEALQAILSSVTKLAMNESVSIDISDITKEQLYDASMVDWMRSGELDESPGEIVPVITRQHLESFAEEQGDGKHLATRAFNSITRGILTGKSQAYNRRAYFIVPDDAPGLVALRADRLNHFVTFLRENTQFIRGAGEQTVGLLHRYSQSLFQADE